MLKFERKVVRVESYYFHKARVIYGMFHMSRCKHKPFLLSEVSEGIPKPFRKKLEHFLWKEAFRI